MRVRVQLCGMRDPHNLRVADMALQVAVLTYDLTKRLPAEERYGLEQFLRKQALAREEQYRAFHQHWYRLQEQDFRHHLIEILDKELVVV